MLHVMSLCSDTKLDHGVSHFTRTSGLKNFVHAMHIGTLARNGIKFSGEKSTWYYAALAFKLVDANFESIQKETPIFYSANECSLAGSTTTLVSNREAPSFGTISPYPPAFLLYTMLISPVSSFRKP